MNFADWLGSEEETKFLIKLELESLRSHTLSQECFTYKVGVGVPSVNKH